MNDEKWLFRTVALENALDLCFKFLDEATYIREFTEGNQKLSAKDYMYEDETINSRFSKPHFSLSVSELYDLAFLALYEQEMEKRAGRDGIIRIVTDVEDAVAIDPVKSEKIFCDGGLAFGVDSRGGYMPVQHVKVISFELKSELVEDAIVRMINKKVAKRSNYPDVCALVVSIIAEHSDINYQNILKNIKEIHYDNLYFIEHHNVMRGATVISIDTSTMKADRNSLTIEPILKRAEN